MRPLQQIADILQKCIDSGMGMDKPQSYVRELLDDAMAKAKAYEVMFNRRPCYDMTIMGIVNEAINKLRDAVNAELTAFRKLHPILIESIDLTFARTHMKECVDKCDEVEGMGVFVINGSTKIRPSWHVLRDFRDQDKLQRFDQAVDTLYNIYPIFKNVFHQVTYGDMYISQYVDN